MFRFLPHLALNVFGIVLVLTFLSNPAQAQLNNEPFSFKNSPGGLGMSTGGRQAILNDKILDVRPDNLLRAPGGTLLNVTKGPGSSAIVSYEGGGGYLPTYKGTDFRGGNTTMSAGVFNAYFSPSRKSSGASTLMHIHSGATVSTWTARVATGGAPVSYLGAGNPVESWTGMVHTMYHTMY